MNVLYVTPYVPSQIRVRPYQLIRALMRRGHAVTLLCVSTHREDEANISELEGFGANVQSFQMPAWRSVLNSAVALPTKKPLQSVYSRQADLEASLSELVRSGQFDVVHIEHLRGSAYGLELAREMQTWGSHGAAGGRSRVPIIWDSVDCISHLFEQAAEQSSSLKSRLITRLELGRTRTYEGQLLHLFDRVTVTSPVDRMALLRLADLETRGGPRNGTHLDRDGIEDKVRVLPNGVDLEYFAPRRDVHREPAVVLTGKMSYHANVTAALHLVKDIMPNVWENQPQAQVWIVGKDPASSVRALATGDSRIVVTGTVPDLREYLWKAAVSAAPMPYGAGIQNKVMEAMACATPVVASPQGVSAIRAKPGLDLLVGDGAEATASAIVNMLANKEDREAIGAAGRSYVEAYHSWDAVAGELEGIYEDAMCDGGAPGKGALRP